jgi:hypothetical protein
MKTATAWIVLPDGRRERVQVPRKSWRTRVKHYLWEIGLLELPFYEQPEIPMMRGEPLRAILAARNFGRA